MMGGGGRDGALKCSLIPVSKYELSALACHVPRTVDVGIPQLSMHSIREQCAAEDVGSAYRHFLHFFQVLCMPACLVVCRVCEHAYYYLVVCLMVVHITNILVLIPHDTPFYWLTSVGLVLQDINRLDATLDVDSLPPPNNLGVIRDVACGHLH